MRPAGYSPRLQRLIAHLWSPDDGILTATNTRPPQGYREVESYLVMRSVNHPDFLVPLTMGRTIASASLLTYNRLRIPKSRALRVSVAIPTRAGLLPFRQAQRLRVYAHRDLSEDDLTGRLPTRWLAHALDTDPLVAAISVPAEGPNSKPTLQLFTSDGTPAGYAKFGWNESTARQVRNEVEAVNRMAARVSTLQIPAVAWSSCWRGFDVAVIEPMAKEARTWHGYVPPPLSVTEEIGQAGETRTCALGDSALVKELLASTEEQPAGTEPALQALFRSAVDGVIARRGEVVLRNGAWHGDWVPWNLATAAGRTIAWDWEHSSSSAPLGFDLLHWHFQIAFIARKQSLVDALDNAKNGGAEDVVTIQGSPAALEACVDLYALELTSRYLRMHAAGAGWHPRFYPAITQVLTDLGAGG